MADVASTAKGYYRFRRRMRGLVGATAGAASLTISPALAQTSTGFQANHTYVQALARLDPQELAVLALVLGVFFFAVLTAIMLVRTHNRAAACEFRARAEIASLQSDVDRLA